MKRRVKLTITNLGNDDASAIVGLIPDTADYTMQTEKGRRVKNGRSPDRAPRRGGTTIKLMGHMADNNGTMIRERAHKMLKSLGAVNPSAQVSGAIASGYMTESKNHKLTLTADGRERVGAK